MSNYHNLLSTAAERGLDLHFKKVDGENVSVTALFEDDPSDVCGLSCLVTGASGLDDAAPALIPGTPLIHGGDPRRDDHALPGLQQEASGHRADVPEPPPVAPAGHPRRGRGPRRPRRGRSH